MIAQSTLLELLQNPNLLPALKTIEARRNLELVRSHPREFRRAIVIEGQNRELICYADAMDDWQRVDAEMMDNAWLRAVGRWTGKWDDSFVTRSYLERARGHSKTTDLAVQALFALFSANRLIWGYVISGSKDQANLLYLQMKRIGELNPWILDEIDIGEELVINHRTGSFIKILSSNAETSIGQTPDFLILDELSHWKKESLFNNVYSSAAKLDHCVVSIITNAVDDKPFGWHWRVREACRTDNDPEGLRWHFRSLPAMSASWISRRQMNDQRTKLTPAAFLRFWMNKAIGKEKYAIPPDQIEAAVQLPGPYEGGPRHNYTTLVGGLDLGISHDHAAFVVIGCRYLESMKPIAELLLCHSWRPKDYETGRIPLRDVQAYILRACKRLGIGGNFGGIVYDPSQAELMAENLRAKQTWTEAFQEIQGGQIRCEKGGFSAQECTIIATALLDVFANKKLLLYRDEDMIGDLGRLTIKDDGMRRKLTAVSDEAGHADRASALGLAMSWVTGTLAEMEREAESKRFAAGLTAAGVVGGFNAGAGAVFGR